MVSWVLVFSGGAHDLSGVVIDLVGNDVNVVSAVYSVPGYLEASLCLLGNCNAVVVNLA